MSQTINATRPTAAEIQTTSGSRSKKCPIGRKTSVRRSPIQCSGPRSGRGVDAERKRRSERMCCACASGLVRDRRPGAARIALTPRVARRCVASAVARRTPSSRMRRSKYKTTIAVATNGSGEDVARRRRRRSARPRPRRLPPPCAGSDPRPRQTRSGEWSTRSWVVSTRPEHVQHVRLRERTERPIASEAPTRSRISSGNARPRRTSSERSTPTKQSEEADALADEDDQASAR